MVFRFVVPCLAVLGLLSPNTNRVCIGQANYWMVSQDAVPYGPPSTQDTAPYYPLSTQDVAPYHAPSTDYSALPVDMALDERPNQGLFFQYDRLYMTLTSPSDGVIGDPAQDGWWTVNGVPTYVRNSLETSWDDSAFSLGHRYEFGWVGRQSGWIASWTTIDHEQTMSSGGGTILFNDPDNLLDGYQDSNNDGYDDALNLNNIYGRTGEDIGTGSGTPPVYAPPFDGVPDTPAVIDTGDMVSYTVIFEDIEATSHIELDTMELMAMFRHPGSHFGQTLDWYLGVRYMCLNDELNVSGTGSIMNGAFWDTSVENRIFGPQIGARWTRRWGYFGLTAEGLFTAGLNSQRAHQMGSYAGVEESGGPANGPANLFASSFTDSYNDVAFSPVGEWRIEGTAKINHCVAFRIGYTGMVIGGISRAAPKIAYELPDFGLSREGSQTAVFTHALTAGVEFNR